MIDTLISAVIYWFSKLFQIMGPDGISLGLGWYGLLLIIIGTAIGIAKRKR
jgi:hypothetical protein